MFESVMHQVGDMNIQVPLGYVLTAVGVLFGTYWVVKKAFMLVKLVALGILARFSIAMLGSSALFLTGLVGVGNSVGTIKDGNAETKVQNAPFVEKSTINRMTQDKGLSDEARKIAFDYAKEQDSRVENNKWYVSIQNQKIENKEVSMVRPWTVFTGSIGMIAVGIVWMLRRWHE